MLKTSHLFVGTLAASSLMTFSSAYAQSTSATWNTDAAGNWTDPLNWLGDTAYAEGADNTATFGNFIGADRIVTLNAGITIGNITAADTTHNYTISGANTLTLDRTSGTPTIDVTTSGRTLTISSDVTGNDGLQKTGAGRLILSGTNNTYSGTTTLSAGTLQGYYGGTSLNPVSPFGTSSLLLNGGTLELYASGSVNSTAETVNFGNNVTVGADATLYVNRVGGTSTNKTMGLGALTIGANTLYGTAANVACSAGFNAVTLTGNATFSPGQYSTLVLGSITQSGGPYSLTKTGVGTLRLTGTNDYAGGTVLNGGTVVVNANAALGADNTSITFGGTATLSNTATIDLGSRAITLNAGAVATVGPGTNSAISLTTAGAVTGSGDLAWNAGRGGILTLSSSSNTFTGALSQKNAAAYAGSIVFNSIGDAPGAGAIIFDGTKGGNPSTVDIATYIRYTGTSALTLNHRQLTLSASTSTNSIRLFENNATNPDHTVTINTDLAILGTATNTGFSLGGTNTGANTFAGKLSDVTGRTLTFVKSGTGTWVLGGANTYTGPTTVSSGTLLINGSTASNSAVTIASAGTLGGTGTVGGATTLNGTLSPGNSPGTLTFSGDLTVNNGARYAFEGGDLTAVEGVLDLNDNWTLVLRSGLADGGSVTIFTYGSLAATPDLSPTFNLAGLGFTPSTTLTLTDTGSAIVLNGVSVVPEPATLGLLAMGAVGLMRRRR